MSPVTRRGGLEVEVRIVADPEGAPAILLQLPDGFVVMKRPGDAEQIAEALVEAAAALEGAQ